MRNASYRNAIGFAAFWVVAAGLSAVSTQAEDGAATGPALQPPMSARVDELLEMRLSEEGLESGETCDDWSFVRRAYLDLTGTPPTASEAEQFANSNAVDKRPRLIDSLLASPASAMHLARTWSEWMLPEDSPPQFAGQIGLQGWLRDRFAENLRYDRLVADLLVASGSVDSGPTAFFVALENKPEKIAAKTARVFLGIQLDCAECHDHPFDDWKQTDFWGFAAYFARLSPADYQPGMATVEVTDVDQGEVLLPGTQQVIPPSPLVETGFSNLKFGTRRQQLTLWLTARENPFVARAAVNRVWALLFGRGLIEPIDDMRSLDLASHPKLLQELSTHFASSDYDLQELLATLAKTRAYARATYSGNIEARTELRRNYALMPSKPLTGRQLVTSLTHVARQFADEEAQATSAALIGQLGKLRGDGGAAKLGMVSALVALHGPTFDSVSREGTSSLLKALEAPYFDDVQRIRWLFLATLARPPSAEELETLTSDLDAKDASWQSDLLWALINSTEFAMTP